MKDIKKDPLFNKIIYFVGKEVDYSIEELKIRSRKREFVFPRQLYMFFLQRHTKITLNDIGRIFERDHATVLHAKRVVNNLIDTDRRIKNIFLNIENSIVVYKSKNINSKNSIFKNLLSISELNNEEVKFWIERFVDAP